MAITVVLLGRGASLRRLSEIESTAIIILANCFWDSSQVDQAYYRDSIVNEFIKDKDVILMMTPTCKVNSISTFLRNYRVRRIYKTQCRHSYRIGTADSIRNVLPDTLIAPFMNMNKLYPNAGTLGVALLYARHELGATHVIVAGQDFYERDYYLKNNHDYMAEMDEAELIKRDWSAFYASMPDIQFEVYTLADFKPNIPNVSVM